MNMVLIFFWRWQSADRRDGMDPSKPPEKGSKCLKNVIVSGPQCEGSYSLSQCGGSCAASTVGCARSGRRRASGRSVGLLYAAMRSEEDFDEFGDQAVPPIEDNSASERVKLEGVGQDEV